MLTLWTLSQIWQNRVVQQNFAEKIEVLCMQLDKARSIVNMTSIKKYIEYFNFRGKILLDHPVDLSFEATVLSPPVL